jgi:predicted dehydrogenase
MLNIGLIGYGYWGPNLARNFNANADFNLAAIADFSEDRLSRAAKLYGNTRMLKGADDIVNDPKIDVVAIATPVSTHFALARQALENGKHVWVEKPFTDNVPDAQHLIELAQRKGRIIFVDHTFIYTGAVRKIKSIIEKGELGELIYYDSTRVNLGLFQQDVDVIWDLAAHDLSILDYFMPFKKLAVSATGSHYYGSQMVPKSLLSIYMDKNIVAHINVSWLSPVKIRQTLIGGTSKMILWDDNNPSEKVKVYDKGVELVKTKEELYHMKIQYRVGDMCAPKLDDTEALTLGVQHFSECIQKGQEPITGGMAGLEVVKILVASKESLTLKGSPVELG